MKKSIVYGFLLAFGLILLPQSALAGSVVNITKDGVASVTETRVMQIAGGTLYTRLYWGNAYVRLMIKTNSKTQFLRGTGEVTTLSEITVGNMLDIAGELESATDSLTLVASSIRNSSVQKQQSGFSGKVLTVDQGGRKFTLDSKTQGVITVNVKPETTFVKGNRTLDLAHVLVGDTVTKVNGDYDFNTKTLVADSVTTFVDLNQYKLKNFEGKLESVTSTTLPTSLRVQIGKITYTVNLNPKTSVLNKSRGPVTLSRFVVGDVIRIHGAILELDEPIIEAEIVRNLSL